MSYFMKWKKALYAAFAVGIIGFAIYGIYNTVLAFNDAKPSQTSGDTLTSGSSGLETVPGGAFCNPYGCAGCSGCVSLQYQQNINKLPSSGVQVEGSY
jgi:hypothetical protein